jgi:hypothetical protein
MRISKQAKVEALTTKDDPRYALHYPVLDADYIVATNAHALAVVRIERADDDVDGPVPLEALKAARAGRKSEPSEIALPAAEAHVTTKTGSVKISRPEINGSFPSWRKTASLCPPAARTIYFNARKLADLAAAMGAKDNMIALTLAEGAEDMILVQPCGDPASFGLLMPCRGWDANGKVPEDAKP